MDHLVELILPDLNLLRGRLAGVRGILHQDALRLVRQPPVLRGGGQDRGGVGRRHVVEFDGQDEERQHHQKLRPTRAQSHLRGRETSRGQDRRSEHDEDRKTGIDPEERDESI